MKIRSFLCLFLVILATACQPEPSSAVPPTNPAEVSVASPTNPPASATPLPAPTATVTPTRPPTATPIVAPTNPPVQVAFYRLRIEYTSTTDWTTLEILNPETVLTARLLSTSGSPEHAYASASRLELNQPLGAAEKGSRVGLTLDLALDPAAVEQPLKFLLQKGALNGSVVRFFRLVGDQPALIREVSHQTVVAKDPGFNPLTFSLDLSRLKQDGPIQATVQPAVTRKMVWAFYYPWYRLPDWSSNLLRDRPQTRYAANDIQAITRHIEQAQSAGIDGFISSWWGPGDYTDQNLKLLLNLAAERSFSVTIYFETLTESGALPQAEITRWLSYAIRTYRDHPAWVKVNGKPVIVLWASGAAPLEMWQSVFADLRAQGLEVVFLGMGYDQANLAVFDGLHEYGIFNIPNLVATLASTGRATRYYSLLEDGGAAKIWAATVQPGYDDRLIPGREGLLQERQNGDFYRSTFEAAIASQPDWIFITTWNEWWEHTYIEPSELYGDLYLQITREYASEWKEK